MRTPISWRHPALAAAVVSALLQPALAGEPAARPVRMHRVAHFLPHMIGLASWYAGRHVGRRTASGEIHSTRLRTAAHRDLPFGTRVRVTNLKNGLSSVVTIDDRGPFAAGRLIDVSEPAARDLAMVSDGITSVRVEVLAHE